MRTLARRLGTILAVAGVLLVVYAAMVVFWRDPVTSIYTAYEQHEMSSQLGQTFETWQQGARGELGISQTGDRHARGRRRLAGGLERDRSCARRGASRSASPPPSAGHTGRPLGRIRISRIGLSTIVVENTDYWGSLSKGPGRYEEGSFPGLGQTTGIAGHRTTFAAPFRHIDSIRVGDPIVVQMPYGTFTYRVLRHRIVDNGDWSIMRKVGFDELVLSACHPLYSAEQRYVVFARLAEREARGREPHRAHRARPPRDRRRSASAEVDQVDGLAGGHLAVAHRHEREGLGQGGAGDLMREIGAERLGAVRHDAARAAPAGAAGSRRRAVVSGSRKVCGPASPAPARRRSDGQQQQLEPDQHRQRIARQPDDDAPVAQAAPGRAPGLHRDAPEQLLDAERGQRGLDVIARPDRDAAGGDHDVRLARARARAPRASPRRRRARARSRHDLARRPAAARAIRMLFDSWIWPCASGSPGATSSSPVTTTHTRGARWQRTSVDAAGRDRPPARAAAGGCPPRPARQWPVTSVPRRRTWSPGSTGPSNETRSPSDVRVLDGHDRIGARPAAARRWRSSWPCAARGGPGRRPRTIPPAIGSSPPASAARTA